MIQCYRCRRYGHTTANCAGEADRSRDCHNCGESGHVKAQCKNGKKCPLCNKEGHRSVEGACPVLRKALRQAQTNRRRHPEEENAVDAEGDEKGTCMEIKERKEEKGEKRYTLTNEFIRNLVRDK